MHRAVLRPSSEGLALVVEQESKETPQQNQRRIRHNRRDICNLLESLALAVNESTYIHPQ